MGKHPALKIALLQEGVPDGDTVSQSPHIPQPMLQLSNISIFKSLKQFNQDIWTESPEGWQGRNITLLIMHGPNIPLWF